MDVEHNGKKEKVTPPKQGDETENKGEPKTEEKPSDPEEGKLDEAAGGQPPDTQTPKTDTQRDQVRHTVTDSIGMNCLYFHSGVETFLINATI